VICFMKFPFSHQDQPTIILIAPYCFSHTHPWYSPGRSTKLQQVEDLLTHIGFAFFRLGTAQSSSTSHNPRTYNLCSSLNPLLRILQIPIATFRLIPKFICFSQHQRLGLWVYNCRLSETLAAIVICSFLPSIPLFLQLEDLPFARPFNSGIRGLIDLICLQVLSARATHIFAVSQQVGISLQRLTPFIAKTFTLLPPTLSDSFLQLLSTRPQPFNCKHISLLYAGGYSREKGVSTLLNAFSRLPPEQYKLTLVGPVPDSIASLKYSYSNLIIVGHVSTETLYAHYCTSDVVVSPHQFGPRSSLIFPFKLLEYIASGSFLLTTPMAGLDSFGLPSACFFSSTDELHLKLLNVRSLWHENSKTLQQASSNVRQSYSRYHMMQKIRNVLLPYM